MDDKTLEALKQSIKKWYEIAYNGGVDKCYANCQLCLLNPQCGEKCLIRLETGVEHCEGTPYIEWYNYHYYNYKIEINCLCERELRVFDEKSQQLAIAEYKFLKSLLPEGEK